MASPNSGFYLTWLGWHVSSTQLISPMQSSIQVTQPSLSLCLCVTLDQCWPTSLTHLSFLVENESIKSSNNGLYFDMIRETSFVNWAHQPNAAQHPRHPHLESMNQCWPKHHWNIIFHYPLTHYSLLEENESIKSSNNGINFDMIWVEPPHPTSLVPSFFSLSSSSLPSPPIPDNTGSWPPPPHSTSHTIEYIVLVTYLPCSLSPLTCRPQQTSLFLARKLTTPHSTGPWQKITCVGRSILYCEIIPRKNLRCAIVAYINILTYA